MLSRLRSSLLFLSLRLLRPLLFFAQPPVLTILPELLTTILEDPKHKVQYAISSRHEEQHKDQKITIHSFQREEVREYRNTSPEYQIHRNEQQHSEPVKRPADTEKNQEARKTRHHYAEG